MAYEISIGSFQGPLDLLLHLIEKNKVDIYDIPIAEITEQYIDYMDEWHVLNLEIASEFLVMAATLLEIKSKLLLPNPEESEEEYEYEDCDPRQELVERLIEYKKYKKISVYLKEKEKIEEKVVYKDPEYYPEFDNIEMDIEIKGEQLYKAFKRILLKKNLIDRDKRLYHEINKDVYTIDDKMDDLLAVLHNKQFIFFSSLFENCHSRNELITIFLAILELIKIKKIKVMQKTIFEDFVLEII